MSKKKKKNRKYQQQHVGEIKSQKNDQDSGVNFLSNEDIRRLQKSNETNKLRPGVTTKDFNKGVKSVASAQQANNENGSSFAPKNHINLPKSAASIFRKNDKLKIDNLYLLHHKYSLRFEYQDKLEKPESFLKAVKLPSLYEDLETGKKKKLPRPMPCGIDQKPASSYGLAKRTEDLAKACSGGEAIHFPFKLLDKLVIGMGGESPYDDLLLITLHPLYGLPYLPATAIKGMLLSYYEQTDKLNQKERDKLFGSKNNAGNLIFFDTFPKEKENGEESFEIGFDVFTPHYGNYYSGKGSVEPTDDQKTTVVTFPVIRSVCFDVYIACREDDLRDKYSNYLKNDLEQAFKYYGIGAKTALGYGLSE